MEIYCGSFLQYIHVHIKRKIITPYGGVNVFPMYHMVLNKQPSARYILLLSELLVSGVPQTLPGQLFIFFVYSLEHGVRPYP